MDFDRSEMLDGLEGKQREARKRLLNRLYREGVRIEELRTAVAEDRLALLPLERVLGGVYTAEDIEQRTGFPADFFLHFRRQVGLPEIGPEERLLSEDDIGAAESIRRFIDLGLEPHSIAEVTRVIGESMARIAATTASVFVGTFLEQGDTEYDVAIRFAELAKELAPAIHPALTAIYDSHLREAVRRTILSRAELEAGAVTGAQEVAVCFVDVVGFTRLGAEAEIEDLGDIARKLAALANELAHPPVRLIKTIGDAAMFVSPEPTALVAVALDLVEAAAKEDLPSLRAGIAYGAAVSRAGDFFGHSVNLASRVTGIARPESVLCTEEVRDAAAGEFDWSFAGKHRIKGVEKQIPLHRPRVHRETGE